MSEGKDHTFESSDQFELKLKQLPKGAIFRQIKIIPLIPAIASSVSYRALAGGEFQLRTTLSSRAPSLTFK